MYAASVPLRTRKRGATLRGRESRFMLSVPLEREATAEGVEG